MLPITSPAHNAFENPPPRRPSGEAILEISGQELWTSDTPTGATLTRSKENVPPGITFLGLIVWGFRLHESPYPIK